MSYETLADQLEALARHLRKHADRLDGLPLAKAAEKLRTALAGFQGAADTAIRGADPELRELRDVLEGSRARTALDVKTLKLLAKRATGKALTIKKADTPEDERRRFVEAAVKHGKVHDALATVQGFLADYDRPAPDTSDRDAVLAEVWRVGRLSGTDLDIEKARLLANPTLLHAMAGFTHIKTTARTPAKTILTKVLVFSRQVNENIS